MDDDMVTEIARRLYEGRRITGRQFDVWLLHRQGHTCYAISEMWRDKETKRGPSTTTVWRELQRANLHIVPAVNEAQEGAGRLGVTIEQNGEVEWKQDSVLMPLASNWLQKA